MGLASVYRHTGARCSGKVEVYERLEAEAQSKTIGQWSLGDEIDD